MRFITGGKYQGKREFVVQKYGISEEEIFDVAHCPFAEIYHKKCIADYDNIIKILMDKQENPLTFTQELLQANPDVIITMNEVGNGIVPVDKEERLWREQVGKIGCMLAQYAQSVERILFGLSLPLK